MQNEPVLLPKLDNYDLGVKVAISVWQEWKRAQVLPFKFKIQLEVLHK